MVIVMDAITVMNVNVRMKKSDGITFFYRNSINYKTLSLEYETTKH